LHFGQIEIVFLGTPSGGIDLSSLFKSLPGAQAGLRKSPAGILEFTYCSKFQDRLDKVGTVELIS
jgi:hypothetical protein